MKWITFIKNAKASEEHRWVEQQKEDTNEEKLLENAIFKKRYLLRAIHRISVCLRCYMDDGRESLFKRDMKMTQEDMGLIKEETAL